MENKEVRVRFYPILEQKKLEKEPFLFFTRYRDLEGLERENTPPHLNGFPLGGV